MLIRAETHGTHIPARSPTRAAVQQKQVFFGVPDESYPHRSARCWVWATRLFQTHVREIIKIWRRSVQLLRSRVPERVQYLFYTRVFCRSGV